MQSVWILVTWDEGMPNVKHFEDEHDAIEMLKEAKPMFTAYLYQCNPDGMISKVEGW
jgi:hypothetical protein